jgi:4-hydroxy-2-oxoheptanedioate aldolase
MVDTAAQAKQLVAATRYPPEGIRGDGSAIARVSRWGLLQDYVERANDEVCLLVQAETRVALENLDAICAVDGVDGVFVGPADLAASLGHRSNPGHPEGILTADVMQAKRYLEMGCAFVAVGLDARLLARATRALRAQFPGADDLLQGSAKPGSVY